MDELNEIRAAHKRLTKLRAATEPGPWKIDRAQQCIRAKNGVIVWDESEAPADEVQWEAGELIVVLERMVAPDLERLAVAAAYTEADYVPVSVVYPGELALARTINAS